MRTEHMPGTASPYERGQVGEQVRGSAQSASFRPLRLDHRVVTEVGFPSERWMRFIEHIWTEVRPPDAAPDSVPVGKALSQSMREVRQLSELEATAVVRDKTVSFKCSRQDCVSVATES
jgi:hypothetical protein